MAHGEIFAGWHHREGGAMSNSDGVAGQYVRLLDAMAEEVRQDAAGKKDAGQQKVLWGVAAGLEMAACALRENLPASADVAELVARLHTTHVAYLLKKDLSSYRKRPPKLNVKRVVTSRKPDTSSKPGRTNRRPKPAW